MAAQRLTFKAQLAQISVPATSANLGAGFDCFALALDLRIARTLIYPAYSFPGAACRRLTHYR